MSWNGKCVNGYPVYSGQQYLPDGTLVTYSTITYWKQPNFLNDYRSEWEQEFVGKERHWKNGRLVKEINHDSFWRSSAFRGGIVIYSILGLVYLNMRLGPETP